MVSQVGQLKLLQERNDKFIAALRLIRFYTACIVKDLLDGNELDKIAQTYDLPISDLRLLILRLHETKNKILKLCTGHLSLIL
jgi:hypothetical protein